MQTVQSQNSVTNATANTHSVNCPEGTVVVGGGGFSSVANLWVIEDTRPVSNTTWSVRYTKRDGVAGNQTTTVFARCLTVAE